MQTNIQTAVHRVKELLKRTRHAAMATVNDDGSPHNTPFFFVYDDGLRHIYWGSHPDSQHSKNIERSHQIFVVIYDSATPKMGGIYIEANEVHALSGNELVQGLAAHNGFRAKEGKEQLTLEYYTGESPQRMYSATPVTCWILMSEDDKDGLRVRDYRQEIAITELLK